MGKGKIEFRGILKDFKDLPRQEIPENAVKVEGFGSFSGMLLGSLIVFLLIIILKGFLVSLKAHMVGIDEASVDAWVWQGFVLAILSLPLHEYLHILALPKAFKKYIWIVPKMVGVAVSYDGALSRGRCIFVSLFPNLLLGVLPLILWMFLPIESVVVSNTLLTYANLSLICGGGDFTSVFLTVVTVPRGKMVQDSGSDVYWFD